MPIGFIDTWSELEEECPIDVSDIIRRCREFEMYSNINVRRRMSAKKNLIQARGMLKLVINSLLSLFYNQEVIIRNDNDRLRLEFLKQDLHSMLDGLEKQEESLIIEEDHKDPALDRVNLSKLKKCQVNLSVCMDGMIYNSIKRTKREFYRLKEEDKTEENLIYLLFCVVCNSASIFKEVPKYVGGAGKRKLFFPQYQSIAIPYKRDEQKNIENKEEKVEIKEQKKKPKKKDEEDDTNEDTEEEELEEESEAEDLGEYEDD